MGCNCGSKSDKAKAAAQSQAAAERRRQIINQREQNAKKQAQLNAKK